MKSHRSPLPSSLGTKMGGEGAWSSEGSQDLELEQGDSRTLNNELNALHVWLQLMRTRKGGRRKGAKQEEWRRKRKRGRGRRQMRKGEGRGEEKERFLRVHLCPGKQQCLPSVS